MNKITEEQLIKIVKDSKSWNNVILGCGLKILTRSLQRKINDLDKEHIKHLPAFYGGLYSAIGKHTDEFYRDLIKQSKSWDEILKAIKLKSTYQLNLIKDHLDKIGDINYNHLEYPKELTYSNKIPLKDILVDDSTFSDMTSLKNKLKNELGWKHECSGCNKSTYTNNWYSNIPIPIQIDHINGKHSDNRIENLRFLCPSCHALTDTYTGKNTRKAIENKKNPELKIKKKKRNVVILIKKPEEEPIIKYCLECSKEINNESERCVDCIKIIEKPTLEQLKEDIKKFNKLELSVKYNVTISCINKWLNKIDEKPKEESVKNYCLDCNKEIKKKCERCLECYKIASRIVERPTIEQLKEDIEKLGYLQTGKKYGVSDNAVRKWLKKEEDKPEKLIEKNKCPDCNKEIKKTSKKCIECHRKTYKT